MYKILLLAINVIILVTLSFSSVLAFPIFDHIIYGMFINGKTFHSYYGVFDLTFLIRWIPATILFSIYSIIVYLAVRSENKKIWSISLGILAPVFLFLMYHTILSENADVNDYLFFYLGYFIPLLGSFLGTFAIIKVKKRITRR